MVVNLDVEMGVSIALGPGVGVVVTRDMWPVKLTRYIIFLKEGMRETMGVDIGVAAGVAMNGYMWAV